MGGKRYTYFPPQIRKCDYSGKRYVTHFPKLYRIDSIKTAASNKPVPQRRGVEK